MSERMLITKLVRQGDRADLYAKGHKYRDLVLFTLSDLADAGVDYEALQEGEDTPCRFWAHYELSEKLNQNGNPYKDILMLEPVDKPATTTSTDTSAIVTELRAIRRLLETLVDQGQGSPPAWPPEPADLPPPEVALGDGDENADWIGGPETRAQEQAMHDELEAMHQAKENGKTGDGVPMDSQELVHWLNDQDNNPKTCDSIGHLAYCVKKQLGDEWGWPNGTDQEGWRNTAAAWYAYWKALQ